MTDGSLDNIQICRKAELCRLLTVIVSTDGETRQEAMQQVQRLNVNEEFLIHMVEIVSNSNLMAHVRIYTSAVLKQHVEVHWCSTAADFQPPEIHSRTKTKVKELLLNGLHDRVCKVREAIADIITTILPWDWPDSWPELFGRLMKILKGDNEGAAGSLRVLCKFIGELKFVHVQSISTVILREMNCILKRENQNSADIQCQAVKIFSDVVSKTVDHKRSDLIQHYLQPAISEFCKVALPYWIAPNDNKNLKAVIMTTVVMLVDKLPKYVAEFLPNLLPLVWEALVNCAKEHQSNIVAVARGSAAVDTCNDSVGLLTAIVRFIQRLMQGKSGSLGTSEYQLLEYEWIYLQDTFIPLNALHHLISLLEITNTDVQLWNTDINTFVVKEALQFYNDEGVRRATEDLLVVMPQYRDRTIVNGLIMVVMRHLQAEHAKRLNSSQTGVNQNNWKTHEAFLFAFCLLEPVVSAKNTAGSLCHDLLSLLKDVVLQDLNDPASQPLLVGRCLVLGGCYAAHMPQEMASAFLTATVNSLQEDKPVCVKVCAVKAVFSWYYYKRSIRREEETVQLLMSNGPALFEGLCSLAEKFTSAEVLTLTLKSIAFVVQFVNSFTTATSYRICSLAIKAMLEYRTKYSIYRPWIAVIQKLAAHRQCSTSSQKHLTPVLLRMLNTDPPDALGEGTVALDALLVLVRNSVAPLSNNLILTLFPACCNYVVKADDANAFDSGIQVMERYLSVSPQQVISYRDRGSKTGVQYIIDAVVRILTCQVTTTRDEEVFKTLILLVKNPGCMLGVRLDPLLKALLISIQNRNGTKPSRSFLMAWAHLINARFETVLSFLLIAPDQPGHLSPLEYVIVEGFCREYGSSQGEDRKAMKLALGNILQHGVGNQYSRLHQINFRELATGVQVPLLVKICKLVLTELP